MKQYTFEGMEYLISYPADYVEGERYPVVLFLHGAGTRGEDIQLLRNNFLSGLTQRHEEFSFITVAPHCKRGTWFDYMESLIRFVKAIADAPFTDPARLYLFGNSMGGYGVWQLAMSMPSYFAAMIPICGGGMYWNAGQLVNVPIWAFHGADDHVVLAEESVKMVNTVNKLGGNAKLTIYPDTKHDAWTPTFHDREVFAWLFAQRNQNARATEDRYSDSRLFG